MSSGPGGVVLGEVLRDRYVVLEVAGSGGEGTVVRSLDRQHDRTVALKIRHPGTVGRDALLAEARVLLGVPPHPNLPLVREDFFHDDRYVIAMDWVDGTDLGSLVKREGRPGLPVPSVLRWLAEAAAALTHLHTQPRPVLHGDVKPANLILTTEGHLVLVDFGLSSSGSTRGRSGGTRGYLAPELAAGGSPTRASDVYALAATAWALLTGSPPTGIRPDWGGIAPADARRLEEAVRSGLATDPARRPLTPGELVERIRAGWSSSLPTGVLTFCLTDIEGSTARWAADPDVMARALVRHDDIVASVVQEHGGRLLKSMGEGDATVSVFATATAAVEAAAAVQQRLGTEEWPGERPLRVRMGVHTGEAEQRGDDYFGVTLSVAARIRSIARPGEVLMSETSAGLVRTALPDGWALIDLGSHRLVGIDAPVPISALRAPGVTAPKPVTESPYRGLLAFEAGDRERFFGREQVVADVVARLGRGLVAVVGSSGSGKSSVLRAGVAPMFAGARVIRPSEVGPAALDSDTLLVVDQFEELFTTTPPDDRRAFVDALLARTAPCAVAIRADFYGRCSEHPGLAAAVAANQVLLGPMSDHDLRRAITGPAETAGLAVDPALVDLLVDEVAGEPGALPMLSHALRMTWLNRDGRTLTMPAYRATGGLRRAIAASGDELFARLSADDQTLVRSILLRLVEPGEARADTRRRARIDELRPVDVDVARVDSVLAELAGARLVTLDEGTAEISHEALIREWPQLTDWLDEDRDRLRIRRHLSAAATAWVELGRDTGELYRGPRLAAVLEAFGDDDESSELEREFLAASKQEADRVLADERRARRRLRRMLAGLGVALVMAVVAGLLALRESDRAQESADVASVARRTAEVRRLIAESRNLRNTNLDLALLLAAEANTIDEAPDTRGAVHAALLTEPRLAALLHGDTAYYRAAFGSDGSVLALGGTDGTVELWDVGGRAQRRRPWTVPAPVVGLWVEPDGAVLVASGDGTVHRLDPAANTAPSPLFTVDEPILGADLSPDRATMAIAAASGGTTEWDLASGQPVGVRISSRGGQLGGVRFDPTGAVLATVGGDASGGALQLWDRATGAPLGPPLAVTGGGSAGVINVAFSPDGHRLAGTNADGLLTVFDVASRTPLQKLEGGHRDAFVYSVAFSPDGTRLVSVGQDGLAVLWDLATGEPIGAPLNGQAGPTHAVAFRPGGATFVTAGVDGSAALWDPQGTGPVARRLAGPPTSTVAAAPDGPVVAARGPDGVRLLDASTGVQRGPTLPTAGFGGVAFSPSGDVLAVAAPSGSIDRYRVDTGTMAGPPLQGHAAPVASMAFSPDDRRLATGGYDNQLIVFDMTSGEAIAPPIPHSHWVLGTAFSPDGSLLATTTFDGNLALYDGRTLAVVAKRLNFEGFHGAASVAFSPDGDAFATGAGDGTITIWDTATRSPRLTSAVHSAAVYAVEWTPDGALVVTTSTDGTSHVVDAATGRPVGDPIPIPDRGTVSVNSNGTELAVTDPDGVVIWSLAKEEWRSAACTLAGRNLTKGEWDEHLAFAGPHRKTCDGFALRA